jgi:MscS family membrane protein
VSDPTQIWSYLEGFWALVIDIWNQGVFGVDLGQILVALLIFFLALGLRSLFSRLIIGRLRSLAKRTKSNLDDSVIGALEDPLRFVPVVLGIFIIMEYLPFGGIIDEILENLVRSLMIFNIFWILFNVVGPLTVLLPKFEQVFTRPMIEWATKALKGAIIFLGAASILDVWGIEIGPILAGLGLFGVAVALGAQDLFKNLIAGILILAERRFQPGDWIMVEGTVEGTVESIGFRSTRVRRFDMAPVFVPNFALSDSVVTNFSNMTYRRIYWMIGVEYKTTVDQLRQIRDGIETYVLENDAFVPPGQASTFVRIDKFSDSSIDIMLYCFTKTTKWGEWLKIKETLAYSIKDIVENAGSGFAFPSRSIYVETPSGETPEPFVPPEPEGRKPDDGEKEFIMAERTS